VHRSGGPQPGGGLWVHGGPRAMGENEEETSGVPTVGEGGRCGAGGRPVTVR
jgi:hypothetical protein